VNLKGSEISLEDRPRQAVKDSADFLISIHHDSVQPRYLSKWTYQDKSLRYSDKFSGYSIFISKKTPHYDDSIVFAELLGDELLATGLSPTLHHAEKIKGENRLLLDNSRGIYQFDDLIVLKRSPIPALLLECGIILNRDEELRVASDEYRQHIARAIYNATLSFSKKKQNAKVVDIRE
jgi:N-acetylmuramoyl-L-alanine amidase